MLGRQLFSSKLTHEFTMRLYYPLIVEKNRPAMSPTLARNGHDSVASLLTRLSSCRSCVFHSFPGLSNIEIRCHRLVDGIVELQKICTVMSTLETTNGFAYLNA
jgi:hypothetical protein